MSITIRQATAQDLEPMLLWRGDSNAMKKALTREFARMMRGQSQIFLAFSEIQQVGTVQMVFEHEDPDLVHNAVYLQALEVHQDFRNSGIATILCQTLMDRARLAGRSKVTVMVEPNNSPALGFFHKLGFEVFKESRFIWDSEYYPTLCMALEL